VTHPFIEGFTLPQEHDIPLDEIRIECLYEAQNNIPGYRVEGEISKDTGRNVAGAEGLTYNITPTHTTGLDFSKSIFQPYNPVPNATKTDAQPNASRTSVWMKFCRNSSG